MALYCHHNILKKDFIFESVCVYVNKYMYVSVWLYVNMYVYVARRGQEVALPGVGAGNQTWALWKSSEHF